jgi:hypothetical protein
MRCYGSKMQNLIKYYHEETRNQLSKFLTVTLLKCHVLRP